MASTKIHDFTAESTNPIYIDYTALNTKVDYTTSKLTVSFKDVKMRLEKGYFNYHIKAFLAVKFFDSAGKFKSFAGNDSVYKAIYNNDTKVYEYTNNDLLENKIPDTSPSKGTSQRTSPWHYFKAPYLIIEKLSETEGGGATAAWNAVTSARDKSFTIDIPSGAASAKLYIMSDSDPYWQYPSSENWQLWCASCPCGSHATNLDDHINKLEEVEILVEPISTNVRILASADKLTGLFDTVVDYSGTDGFTPTVAKDNKNNSFNATIRPFKKGVNNNIAQVSGSINFYKSNIPTGDYVQMPAGKLIYINTRTPLKFIREAVLDANGNKTYDENGKQIFKEYYKILEDHEYSDIHGVGAYKLVNGKYESISPSIDPNTEKELPYIIPENLAVYRRVFNNIYPKTIRFDSWADNKPNFNIEPWLTSMNNNEAKDLTLTWPLAVTPITCNEGKENEYIQLCGTSAVWIDFFAKATTFTKTGLETINGYDYIRLDKFENPEFYKDKNYSFEYFIRNRVYSKGTDANGNVIMVPSNRPPYSYDYINGQVINGPPKVADTITVVEDGVKVQKPFDKTKHYYMTNRSSMGSDIRKSYWLNTGFYSYPRAPRELWYESTHKNKTYVSDISKIDKVPGENRSYKENLRPCLKDTFIWRWDKAFGDIYDADEPSNYRIFIYKKANENDPAIAVDAAMTNSEGKLVVNTALVNGTNITRNTTGAGTPCFEITDKYIILNLKELGFKSGDYCGCRIYSFIIRGDGSRVYSSMDLENPYLGLYNDPSDYTVSSSATAFKNSAGTKVSEITITNNDYSLYGNGGYSSQGYDPDKSFAEGGCPSIDPKYNYIESLTDCEVRSGATVWIKISDTNTPEKDWVEGTPWVKTNEGWKEADSLHVKTDNSATGWKESD